MGRGGRESALRRMNLALGDRAEGGRRHGRGARRHRPRARPRAERLRKPGAAADDPVRGGVRVGAGAARQPAELRISPAPAAGHLRRRRHRRPEKPLPERRLAGEGARRGGRRHPLLARPADAVHRPDRALLAAGRRGRRGQCHLELPGRPPAHHRHAEVPGRARAPGLLDLSHPAHGAGAGRRRGGAGDRRRPAVRRPVGDRRRPAGARAGGALRLAAHHRRGLRPAGVAAVRPDAAAARAPRVGRHADARRGRPGRPAGVARCAADRRRGAGARRFHHLHRRKPAHRRLVRAGRDRRLHRLPVAGAALDAGRRARRQAPAGGAAVGARQPASAGGADANRHAVAGAWPHRAGGDGADRGQPARADHRAHPERRAGLLLRRHPVDPDAGLREGARRDPGRGDARQGAVAARPHHQDRRQAGRTRSPCRRTRAGRSTATAA